jgi:hypothetical protein
MGGALWQDRPAGGAREDADLERRGNDDEQS